MLADYFLARFAKARGVLMDTSEALLEKNGSDPRKTLLCWPAERMLERLEEGSFDVICMHSLLHHIVDGKYGSSGQLVREILLQAARLLKPKGRLSLWEPVYDGWLIDTFPSRMIFRLTSSRIAAPICRLLGANTAGVGVRFQSSRQWRATLKTCGFTVVHWDPAQNLRFNRLVKSCLLLQEARSTHLWCAKE